jgi:hypothetical protein
MTYGWNGQFGFVVHGLVVNFAYGRQEEDGETATGEVEDNFRKQKDREEEAGQEEVSHEGDVREGVREEEVR